MSKVIHQSPRKPRPGEVIGGGYFVFRRGDGTKRIRPSQWPFEHPSFEAALAEAVRHAKGNPGHQYDVLSVVASETAETAAEAIDTLNDKALVAAAEGGNEHARAELAEREA